MPETKAIPTYRLHILLGMMFGLVGVLTLQPDAGNNVSQETGRDDNPTRGRPAQATDMTVPATITRAPLPPALGNPFTSTIQTAAPIAKPIETPPPPPPAPPPVVAPPLNLQFIGRVTHADGKEMIYMAHGDNTLTISEGQRLSNGYKVDEVTRKTVRFSHPQLENPVLLELPAPPTFQIR